MPHTNPSRQRSLAAKPARGPHFAYFVEFALIICMFCPVSFGHSCAGIFYPHAAADLGCGTGVLSYFTPLACLSGLIFMPFAGRLLNSWDARICLAGSCAIAGLAFFLLSFTTELWQYLACGVLMGFGTATLIYLAPATLVNRWFEKNAGFYIGLVAAFTGIGGVVWAAVGGMLIQEVGWQWTHRIFSFITFACIPIMIFCVASRPSDKGLLPHGASEAEAAASSSGARRPMDAAAIVASLAPGDHPRARKGIPAKEAFKMPQFYLIMGFAFFLNCGMYLNGMIPSYVSTLAVGAAIPMLGSLCTSLAMAAQTGTKLVLGYASEKHPYAGSIVCASMGIVGVALLLMGGASGAAVMIGAAAALYGVYYGVTNVMSPSLARKTFGGLEYPIVYARISMAANVAGVLSGFVWGAIIDLAGFEVAYLGGVAVISLAIACTVGIAYFQKRDIKRFLEEAKNSEGEDAGATKLVDQEGGAAPEGRH